MPIKVLTAFLIIMPVWAFAQSERSFASVVGGFIEILNILVQVLITLAVVLFVYGIVRFLLALSKGSEEGILQGKRFMVWGIIALFVLASMWAIVWWFKWELGIHNEPNESGIVPLLPSSAPPAGVDYYGDDPINNNPFETV